MHKKLLSLILCGLVTFSLVACGNSESLPDISEEPIVSESAESTESPESTETESVNPVPDETETQLLIDEYNPIIKDAMMMVYYGAEPLHEEFYAMQGETMYWDDDTKDSLGFCFYDLDGNGYKELIIGNESNEYILATYDDNGPRILLGSGYRSMATIYEQGLVVYEGSSGAACYSYDFFNFENGELNLKEFYYTDYDENAEDGIAYFHNTTGEWTLLDNERITEDEFAMGTEIGLEKLDLSPYYMSVADYKDELLDVTEGYSMERLTADGITWSLTERATLDGYTEAGDDANLQTLNFNADGTVAFYCLKNGAEVGIDSIEASESESYPYYDVELSLSDGTYQSIYVLGFTSTGLLVTERYYYDSETGEAVIAYEYYAESVG